MCATNSLDKKLAKLLGENGRLGSEALAESLGVSPTTIRRRIRKLTQSGVMRILAVVDPEKAGFPLIGVIAFNIVHEKLESALEVLAGRPEIKWVSTTTGRFDILALGCFHSTGELSDFVGKEMASIEGLKDSETFICLQVKKGRYIQI